MATSQMTPVMQHLRRFVFLRDALAMTDEQLLESFARRRDEVAFEVLIRRHGPLVMGVCRRVLRSHHDAEDAFQATFLILARKAASIAPRGSLGNWLYRIAFNAALKAKTVIGKRRLREKQVADMPESAVAAPSPWQDLQAVLDEELGRLPDKYLTTIILCDLEGKTRTECAAQLGWPEGTVAGRLARARALLAKRLTRRGVALSAGALASATSPTIASANVSASVITSTIEAASLYAAGQTLADVVSSNAAVLAEGVLKAMILNKIKTVTVYAAAVFLVSSLSIELLATGNGRAGLQSKSVLAPSDQPQVRGQEPQRPPAKEAERPQATVTWKERHTIEVERGTQIFSASISPDGKVVAYGMNEGTKLLDAVTGKELALVDKDVAFSTAISPDGKILATGGIARGGIQSVKLWDAATGKELATLADDTKNICKVAFAPGGKLLATAEGWALRLWDLETNKESRRFDFKSDKPEERVAFGVAFSPDGKTLASAEGQAKAVKLWDVASGKELKSFEGHTKWVIDVAFSPDGKTLASAGGEVKLWDVETGKQRAVFNLPTTNGRHSLAFSPDGKLLAMGGGTSNNVIIWDLQTGKEAVPLAHTEQVWSVAFSRDGTTLVTAGDDAVRIWKAEKK
jgi:RNA polymerase sigma factor (sigma-70 family)